jgi:hypothetical protein
MADGFPRLRIVAASEQRPPGRRRPGPGVVLILLYALLFGAGLWWFRAKSPLFRSRRAALPALLPASGGSPPSAPSPLFPDIDSLARRTSLLAGDGLPAAARVEYGRRISADRCTCGCELTVRACLARDAQCGRSAELAQKIRTSLR